MESYINSGNITGFPIGKRQGTNNANGTLLTESRLSSLVNSLLDINGFVVSPAIHEEIVSTSGQDMEVNIAGRYFKINNVYSSIGLDSVDVGITNIYLGIYIPTSGIDELYYEIDGQDDQEDGKYNGLRIIGTSASTAVTSNNDNTYSITSDGTTYLCVKVAELNSDDSKWYVPEPEYSKISFIDAGEL